MKEIIISEQKCDMGLGTGKYEFDLNTNLSVVLSWLCSNIYSWGIITIEFRDGKILRKFDYDLYNNEIFYYNLSWEKEILVKEIKFDFCFMNKDITIILDK